MTTPLHLDAIMEITRADIIHVLDYAFVRFHAMTCQSIRIEKAVMREFHH